ncbi:SDR family NAD(P)-dependent oxidoreductase [Sphingorhabdus sp.]|jgi:NAD(P)-dependent dehydrogenase (short-subunit alcohol dehydrogenase family)|uniref:SDR family NAD(P)-dependent oxidoreductase n=1 Tax=Sphingorhabdus sp. TaxID=1902408 RepID=UPI0037C615A7
MNIDGIVALVTGGASGLGLATARRLLDQGAKVVIVDLPTSDGKSVAASLGAKVRFVAGDVTNEADMKTAIAQALGLGPLRATVHCAGRGHTMRILDREGNPGSLEAFEGVIKTNLIGSFNVLRMSAAAMAKNEPLDEERGAIIMTASVAAYEGQIGQIPYASSKAGVVGMTLVAARDLATKMIRVCTIAPGIFDTPLLARLSEEVRASLGSSVPHPARLGKPEEFALMATQILENPVLNGETIRLDGALRMPPR